MSNYKAMWIPDSSGVHHIGGAGNTNIPFAAISGIQHFVTVNPLMNDLLL